MPQIPLRKKPVKDAGPRALGLLKLTPDGKATLAPITIMLGDKFYDATAYKARPVPMALESGTVYDAERTGTSLGLFTVHTALHSQAINAVTPWIATGSWLPAGTEKATTKRKAETVPVGIGVVDERPRLTRDPARLHLPAGTSAEQSGSGTSGESKPEAKIDEKPASDSKPDGDRPTLKRPHSDENSTSDSKPDSKPAETKAGEAKAAETKPAETKPAEAKPQSDQKPAADSKPAGKDSSASTGGQASSQPAPPAEAAQASAPEEGNRLRLRRGKPTEPLPSEDDVPGYSKPGSVSGSPAAATGAKNAENPAAKGAAQLFAAISDAAGPDPRSFEFNWNKGDEEDRRKQMTEFAKQKLHDYLLAQAKRTIAAKPGGTPAAPKTGARKTAAKPTDPPLSELQMNTYDLWGNNTPVMVLSAIAQPQPVSGAANASAAAGPHYSLLVVARTDIYNNLRPLYVGVTDQFHLDLTPRLELIDAVDADGDGRGELLFRETSDAGSGYIIYRATADSLWKMFDSLHPE